MARLGSRLSAAALVAGLVLFFEVGSTLSAGAMLPSRGLPNQGEGSRGTIVLASAEESISVKVHLRRIIKPLEFLVVDYVKASATKDVKHHIRKHRASKISKTHKHQKQDVTKQGK